VLDRRQEDATEGPPKLFGAVHPGDVGVVVLTSQRSEQRAVTAAVTPIAESGRDPSHNRIWAQFCSAVEKDRAQKVDRE
jgi:hypothetical protein